LGNEGDIRVLLVFGPIDADSKTGCFPQGAHNECPTKLLFTEIEGLVDVRKECAAEDDGEDDGCHHGGVVIVLSITGPLRDVAIFVGDHGYA